MYPYLPGFESQSTQHLDSSTCHSELAFLCNRNYWYRTVSSNSVEVKLKVLLLVDILQKGSEDGVLYRRNKPYGIKNASVLPEPVLAAPSTSRPASSGGRALS